MPKKSACLLWPGAKDKDGYGFVKIGGKQFRAHRVALEKKLGRKLAAGEMALHSCDNPSCVNPEHLDPGTALRNNHQAQAIRGSLAQRVLGVNIYGASRTGVPT